MHNPVSVLENEIQKILGDFENAKDHLKPARRPNLVIINKKRETAEKLILPFQLTIG